jgi:uroporphyrin-3 C-methyltransferase
VLAALGALAVVALVQVRGAQERVKALEAELVKRQTDSAREAAEARIAAKAAQDDARDAAAKAALLEARVAESTLQRSQLEDLIQSLARSRDENVLADLDAALRVALQQSAITGSPEPLVTTLRQADERLARYNQPRLERVRRAVVQDLERVRAAGAVDVNVLSIRLDDVIRQVDELPLLSAANVRPAPVAPARAPTAVGTASPAGPDDGWIATARDQWQALLGHVWSEVRGLVRVTRIDHPEAMLMAPEQAYFLRENLKLRLLNARLALLSRQFDTAQSDLRDVQGVLERYFDRNSRRVTAALESVRQVATQARQVSVPRPDATLAAIATATAGR